jgi:hypothetical protein
MAEVEEDKGDGRNDILTPVQPLRHLINEDMKKKKII